MGKSIQIDERIRAIILNDLRLQGDSRDDVNILTKYLDVDSKLDEEIMDMYVDNLTTRKEGIKFLITEIFLNRVLNINHRVRKSLYPGIHEE